MRKIIINADDLGISLETDSIIEDCIKKGVVTSCTLMANAPAFEDGVRIAKLYPDVSVGVHLNIVEFQPLTNIPLFKKHGIVDDDDCFVMGAINCVSIDDELKEAIFEEWDAQISAIEAAGLHPSHADSHQHTHTIPALQKPLCRALDKHNIRKVRRVMVPSFRLVLRSLIQKRQTSSVHVDRSKIMKPKRRNIIYRRFAFVKTWISSYRWNNKMAKLYVLTDSFHPFRNYYNNEFLRMGKCNDCVELMSHPGHIDYQKETDQMMRDRTWLKTDDILVSYNQI